MRSRRILSDLIAYVKWNYGSTREGVLHLVRLKNGKGVLRTTNEMVTLGLLKIKDNSYERLA